MEFLQNVFQSQDVLVKALLKAPYLLNSNLEKTPEALGCFMGGMGFSRTGFARFVMINPRILLLTSLTPARIDLIHKIGGDKESKAVIPALLGCSKEYVGEKMTFIVNTMEFPANYVVKHPSLLRISLEKIMRPRFLVWQKIKDMNDLGLSLLTVLTMSNDVILSTMYFVSSCSFTKVTNASNDNYLSFG
ncbi:hypothetical protein SUGI_0443410 [Cryptomeria japonica]|nr:hypothetical protein SUGI_0443410 [Cryptomeria japonica]